MHPLIRKLETPFWFLIIISIFSTLGYEIYSHREITPPEKNTLGCASVVYFNNQTKTFDSIYNEAIMFGNDSLVNFTDQNGHVWWEKDFISNEQRTTEDKLDYNDITLKNGERFKVMYISVGNCQTKAIEDSLKEDLKPSEDDDTN